MEKETKKDMKYIAVVSVLESGRLQIRFPDFEGLMGTAETEEMIEKTAAMLLEMKVGELRSLERELPKASSALEIGKSLKAGEITVLVPVKKDYLSQGKDLGKDLGKVLQEKLAGGETAVNDSQVRLAGFLGGALLLLAIFLPFYKVALTNGIQVSISYFIGLFGKGSLFPGMLQEFGNGELFYPRFLGFLVLFEAIFVLYSYWKQEVFYMLASSILAFPLLVINVLASLYLSHMIKGKVVEAIGVDISQLDKFVSMGMSFGVGMLFLASIVLLGAAAMLFQKHREEILG